MRRRSGWAVLILAPILALGIDAAPVLAAPGTATLYGTDAGGGKLFIIDPQTGVATLVGAIGFSTPSLAVDPTTGLLYAGRGSGVPELHRLDPSTGTPTLVGDIGIEFASIPGLEFDSKGVLFASVNAIDDGGTGGDSLATLDKVTGAATLIGVFGSGIGTFNGVRGIETLAFDPSGTLYGASTQQSLTTGDPSLYTIDPATGVATLVATIEDGGGVVVGGGIASLQFGCDGALYGGTGGGTGNLVNIDPATGIFTMIGNAVTRSLGGLAFQSGCGCRPVQSGGPPAWSSRTALPAGRAGAAGVIVVGRIYLTHGRTAATAHTGDTHIYRIDSDDWITGAAAGTPRADLTGVCVEDAGGQGRVVSLGGADATGPLATVESYDPGSDSWSALPAMPTARRGPGAAFVPGSGVAGGSLGTIYVFGGSDGIAPHSGTPLDVTEAYDVELAVWVARAAMPAAMMDIGSTVYFPTTGRIYVIGGYDGLAVGSLVQIYDPDSDRWSAGQPMPTPRSNLVAGVCGARIYAIGGIDGAELGTTESYDPLHDTWYAADPLKLTAVSEMASQAITTGAEIFALGGDVGGVPAGALERLTCGAAPSPCSADAGCDDGVFCNGSETCDIPVGRCLAGAAPMCDDGIVCTEDLCDPLVDGCTNTNLPDGSDCSDGDACNGVEECASGVCAAETAPGCGDIEGSILYYRDGVGGLEPGTAPVAGVALDLITAGPTGSEAVVTDGAGGFVFASRLLGEDYKLSGGKPGDLAGAVSSYDAALSAQAIVGLGVLTPGQALAADVSGNGSVSSFDAALIAQLAVGTITRFPVATVLDSDWFLSPVPVIVPQQTITAPAAGIQGSVAYSPLLAGAAGQDFVAGLFGDVSGNYAPPAVSQPSAEGSIEAAPPKRRDPKDAQRSGPRRSDTARLVVPHINARHGDTIEIAIKVRNAAEAIAFDLALAFDPDVLVPVAATQGSAAPGFTASFNLEPAGRFRLGLFGVVPLERQGELARFTFRVIGSPGGGTELRLSARIDEGRIPVDISQQGRVRVKRTP